MQRAKRPHSKSSDRFSIQQKIIYIYIWKWEIIKRRRSWSPKVKVVAVAYRRWLFTRVANCKALTGKVLWKTVAYEGRSYSLYIFLVVNSCISFIEIRNLIKSLLSLNCQQLPQNTRTFFWQTSKNVGFYTQVFTVCKNKLKRIVVVKQNSRAASNKDRVEFNFCIPDSI